MSTILTAFVTTIIMWFVTNYYGRSLLNSGIYGWNLKNMCAAAHANASQSYYEAKTIGIRSRLHELGIEIDALRAVPKPIFWYLCKRGYDLHGAGQSLLKLSDTFDFGVLVKAQRCLKLPINPSHQKMADEPPRSPDHRG